MYTVASMQRVLLLSVLFLMTSCLGKPQGFIRGEPTTEDSLMLWVDSVDHAQARMSDASSAFERVLQTRALLEAEQHEAEARQAELAHAQTEAERAVADIALQAQQAEVARLSQQLTLDQQVYAANVTSAEQALASAQAAGAQVAQDNARLDAELQRQIEQLNAEIATLQSDLVRYQSYVQIP